MLYTQKRTYKIYDGICKYECKYLMFYVSAFPFPNEIFRLPLSSLLSVSVLACFCVSWLSARPLLLDEGPCQYVCTFQPSVVSVIKIHGEVHRHSSCTVTMAFVIHYAIGKPLPCSIPAVHIYYIHIHVNTWVYY